MNQFTCSLTAGHSPNCPCYVMDSIVFGQPGNLNMLPTPQSQIESLQRALEEARSDIQVTIDRVKLLTGVAYSSACDAAERLEEECDCARNDLRKARAMTARWKKAIEGLTPSGSEYVDDPERCAEYIRQRWSSSADRLRKAHVEIVALREHLAEAETEIDRLKAELIAAIGPDAQRHAEDL